MELDTFSCDGLRSHLTERFRSREWWIYIRAGDGADDEPGGPFSAELFAEADCELVFARNFLGRSRVVVICASKARNSTEELERGLGLVFKNVFPYGGPTIDDDIVAVDAAGSAATTALTLKFLGFFDKAAMLAAVENN